ncbi:hypothetical protein A2U01_0104635, partial [Trifolium medium]|nr:hypothetical protein [Trifolium medium]
DVGGVEVEFGVESDVDSGMRFVRGVKC